MNNITITKASRENFKDIKDLMLIALKEDPFGFGASFDEYNRNSEFWWMSYIEPYFSGSKDALYVVKNSQDIIGMGGLLLSNQERKKHVGLVVWVYILKKYRGQGLATKIMKNIINEARSQNLKKLTLLVNSTQTNAIKLYKKLGFITSGKFEQDLQIEDQLVDTIIMELFL